MAERSVEVAGEGRVGGRHEQKVGPVKVEDLGGGWGLAENVEALRLLREGELLQVTYVSKVCAHVRAPMCVHEHVYGET